MSSSENFKKLQEAQNKGLEACHTKIKQWKTFKEDYEALHERLKTLPDKVSHDVMVPFGSLAFMPGKIVHTNEVSVLLGDNWFVERSAKQAAEIVQRRIKQCDTSLEKLKEEETHFSTWFSYTDQIRREAQSEDGLQEIVEEYDEQAEALWREEHTRKVRAYMQSRPKENVDDDFLDRLDRLEQQELERDELRSDVIEERTSPVEEVKNEPTVIDDTKRVRWVDESKTRPAMRITFRHSEPLPEQHKPPDPDAANESPGAALLIQSPSDIYKQFAQQLGPKSILKKTSAVARKLEVPPKMGEPEPRPVSPRVREPHDGPVAFSGTVVEKDGHSDTQEETVNTHRPLSRFKQQRRNVFR